MSKLNPSSLAKAEPVLVGHFVTWLLVQAGAVAVGRYHLISGSAWSPLASALEPVGSALVLAVVAVVIRRLVTPAWKWLEVHAPEVAAPVEDVGLTLLEDALADADRRFPLPAAEPASAA